MSQVLAVATRLECAGCGAVVEAGVPFTPRCPARRAGDDIDHVLVRRLDPEDLGAAPTDPDPNPFVRYRTAFHAYHVARAAGWPDERYTDLVRGLDEAVAAVDGTGFRATPLLLVPGLARAAGLGVRGAAWAKDETRNVGGSHKARHLFGVLLELAVAEAVAAEGTGGAEATGAPGPRDGPLAIASCGNAALSAAILARAADRELRVFVPDTADPGVVRRLRDLGAGVTVCRRRAGEVGDPSYAALQAAIARGAIPFTCQGPEDGLAIEGGATLAREIVDVLREAGRGLDRIVVQVGGGALASGIATGLADAVAVGALDRLPHLDTVQTRGAWPLARAWARVLDDTGATEGLPVDPATADEITRTLARRRSRYMWPWATEPRSIAHGILDDETYDWLAVVRAMLLTGGRPVVVDETQLVAANALVHEATGVPADETGTAGVAGLLALGAARHVGPDESVAVVLSGVRRHLDPTRPGDEPARQPRRDP